MTTWYGSYTKSVTAGGTISAGSTVNVVTITGNLRIKLILLHASSDLLQFKIYTDGVLLKLNPAYTPASIRISDLQSYFYDAGNGAGIRLTKYSTSSAKYAVEINIEIHARKEFKIDIYNPTSSNVGYYVLVVYEELP